MHKNIVEYFSGHERYRCGYCKNDNTNYSHGIWAHALSPCAYEGLLNRGWRRCGSYVYKPTNEITCCPSYPISCHALDFKISKSQKKVIRKFNDYLKTGILPNCSNKSSISDSSLVHNDGVQGPNESLNYRESSNSTISLPLLKTNLKNELKTTDEAHFKRRKSSESSPPVQIQNNPPIENSDKKIENENQDSKITPKLGKKRAMRLERRKAKLLAKKTDLNLNDDKNLSVLKEDKSNGAKALEDLFGDSNSHKDDKLVFRKKLFKTDSKEFEKCIGEEFELYKKYQMRVHNDEESECNMKQFRRFLIDNPLNESSDDERGAYHTQYLIDDKLVAVGVVDILPTCLSSVYFFYDPDLMTLSLGTYGALSEIAFVRDKCRGGWSEFKYYYLGYYIHTCQKMRYKGNFSPSFLKCPLSGKWRLLDDELRAKLDASKYTPFFNDDEGDKKEKNENINKVNVLYRRQYVPYEYYELQRSVNDTNDIQEFVNLVGEEVAEKIALFRSSGS